MTAMFVVLPLAVVVALVALAGWFWDRHAVRRRQPPLLWNGHSQERAEGTLRYYIHVGDSLSS